MRQYSNELTIDINSKGVLDVDVVKGCTFGIAAHGEKGCYNNCYAAAIAKYRGIDFSKAVVRKVVSKSHAKQIEKRVKRSPLGFFRVGTMGDPCHAWAETVELVEWLSQYATPIIITKHWQKATDAQFKALVAVGAILNTSVSALDSDKHLARREKQIARYAAFGGMSIARVVSCDFNEENEKGKRMAEVQARLMKYEHVIDNPLRIPASYELVKSGVIRIRKVQDLIAVRTISMPENSKTYVGHCNGCSELCGLGMTGDQHPKPIQRQSDCFQ